MKTKNRPSGLKYSVLVTGSEGFIGSHICDELLRKGYFVFGMDNYSKYGPVEREHVSHKNFQLIKRDVIDLDEHVVIEPDYIIACAAMIGGISYFHKYAYDLLATNERITASTFDWAIKKWQEGTLKRIIVMSSSMVFENTDVYPTPEEEVFKCPPPFSTYGFQKLATEYFAQGALEQYELPFTIVRPFNAVGLGEEDFKEGTSHVIPDLIFKALNSKPDEPLEILGNGDQVRCYTHVKDIARGTVMAMESDNAINNDYNISAPQALSVKALATMIWRKIHGTYPVFKSTPPFMYDVQKRIPDTSKAKEDLGFETSMSLSSGIDEIIEEMRKHVNV